MWKYWEYDTVVVLLGGQDQNHNKPKKVKQNDVFQVSEDRSSVHPPGPAVERGGDLSLGFTGVSSRSYVNDRNRPVSKHTLALFHIQ